MQYENPQDFVELLWAPYAHVYYETSTSTVHITYRELLILLKWLVPASQIWNGPTGAGAKGLPFFCGLNLNGLELSLTPVGVSSRLVFFTRIFSKRQRSLGMSIFSSQFLVSRARSRGERLFVNILTDVTSVQVSLCFQRGKQSKKQEPIIIQIVFFDKGIFLVELQVGFIKIAC